MSDEAMDHATPEEAAEATRFAEALEDGTSAEGEALRAARFLQAVGRADAGDDVAARRLRRELVARAATPGRRAFFRAAAAAAAVLLVTFLAVRLRRVQPPSADLLAAREVAAERAVARTLSGRGDSLDAGVAVFEALLRERASATSSPAASSADPVAAPALTPTAGGPT